MTSVQVADNGIPGLTLALRMRLRRHEVTLVPAERRELVSEVFTLPAPYRDLALKTGTALEEAIGLEAAPGHTFTIDGHSVRFPSAGQQASALRSAFGADAAAQWAAMVHDAADVWFSVRSGGYRSTTTAQRRARQHLRDASVRTLFAQYLERYGLDEESVGDAAVVLPYLDQTFGRWCIPGGLTALEAQLRERCDALGIESTEHGEPIPAGGEWDATFAAPSNWRRRGRGRVDDCALGLPWVGIAAQFRAGAMPR